MEIVLKLLDWSLRQHWALGGSFLFFMALMCMPAFRDTAQNPKDRDSWVQGLRDNSPAEFYRSVMRGGLDWLDTRLSSLEAQKGPAQKAWSYGLLDITMTLALAYPILAIMAQWLWGHAIDFGGQEMMAASPPQARIFALVWLGSVSICLFFYTLSQSRWYWLWLILAVGIFILGSIYADDFAVPRNVGGFAVVFLCVFLGAFAFAVAAAAVVVGAGTGAAVVVGAVAFAAAFAVVFVFAVAGAFAVTFAEERSSNPLVMRLFYCGVLLAILVIGIKMPDDFGAGQRNRAVFFMLTFGLLPLFNAVFDFLSAGLTRYLLRLGLEQKRAVWRAILDGLGGIAIFFALGCSLITFVTFVTPADGVPLVDLAQLFANLRTAPGDYIWLMMTLFSTLLPTLVHLSLMLLTLALHSPAGCRNFVAGLLESGAQSRQASFLSGVCICAMITLAVWVPIWIITAVITHDHGATLNAVLWIFETFAWAIGGV